MVSNVRSLYFHSLIIILDVLDAFKADAKPKRPAPQPPTKVSGAPAGAPQVASLEEDPADLFGPEFAAQLQAGMEELLNELGHAPKEGEDPKELAAMREAWEKMLVAGMDSGGADPTGAGLSGLFGAGATPAGPPPPPVPVAPKGASLNSSKPHPTAGPSTSTASESKDEDFQATIRQAMEKLKESDEALKVHIFAILRTILSLFLHRR